MPNGTFKVIVTKKGKDPSQWIKEVSRKIQFEFQQRLVELGDEAAKTMKEVINNSIKRLGSSGKLANSIKSEILSSTAGVQIGIGRISDLPIYWEVINNGGYIPPINLGYFAGGLGLSGEQKKPVSGAGGEQWIHTGNKSDFLLNPSKAIEPMRYVEISEEQLILHITREIDRLIGEFK